MYIIRQLYQLRLEFMSRHQQIGSITAQFINENFIDKVSVMVSTLMKA